MPEASSSPSPDTRIEIIQGGVPSEEELAAIATAFTILEKGSRSRVLSESPQTRRSRRLASRLAQHAADLNRRWGTWRR